MSQRDIRTLLFCKISPTTKDSPFGEKSHTQIYEDLCKVIDKDATPTQEATYYHKQKDKQVFFSFGGYDALITYTPEISTGSSWLRDIYKDKQQIIRSNSPNVVYHQMHLISHHSGNNAFWNAKTEEYPFFLTTLVYGVRRPDDNESISDHESSIYEHVIRTHIKEQRLGTQHSFVFAVYNGISISDVVVLWRARDIGEIMDVISTIEYTGTARKTLTTLCFPLSKTGTIDPAVRKTLEMKVGILDGSVKKKSDQQDPNILHMSIHGNIRDRDLFEKIYQDMSSKVLNHDNQQILSLGKNDFSISAKVDGVSISKLVDYYYSKHDILSKACWEILTDFRKYDTNSPKRKKEASRPPQDILAHLYKEYLDNRSMIDRYSWGDTMLELLGTHYYIDHHPVMHGPSYLIYDGLKIANAYFFRKVTDFTDESVLHDMLMRSKTRILNYIHNLDQLTEQITRNDDAMLNNRSNSRSIHFSIPESALDFYHAFLRRIIDYVVEYDRIKKKKPDDFEYDFLLSPKVRTTFRFSHMFDTDLSYRSEDTKTGKQIWPQKQAYLLDIPIESVFDPLAFFIPVVHECFHCFGDSLRKRTYRYGKMAGFLATTLLTAAGCGSKSYNQAKIELVKMICYGPEYYHGMDPLPKIKDPYLESSLETLKEHTYQALGREGIARLYKNTGGQYPTLYSDHVIIYWTNAKQHFTREAARLHGSSDIVIPETIIEQCGYYFRECYADTMTIALLRLTPAEYLDQIMEETNRHFTDYQLAPDKSQAVSNVVIMAQRYSLVLNACIDRVDGFTEKTCLSALNHTSKELLETSKIITAEFHKLRREIVASEYNETHNDAQIIIEDDSKPSYSSSLPVAALKHVFDYLRKTLDELSSQAPSMSIPYLKNETYNLDQLADDFDNVIRKGNMFGPRFYKLIYQHHAQIREKVKTDSQS